MYILDIGAVFVVVSLCFVLMPTYIFIGVNTNIEAHVMHFKWQQNNIGMMVSGLVLYTRMRCRSISVFLNLYRTCPFT